MYLNYLKRESRHYCQDYNNFDEQDMVMLSFVFDRWVSSASTVLYLKGLLAIPTVGEKPILPPERRNQRSYSLVFEFI